MLVATSLMIRAGPADSSATAVSPVRRPKTSPSSRLLLARRFAPCTPLQAVSPQARSPGRLVRPARSQRTPPIE